MHKNGRKQKKKKCSLICHSRRKEKDSKKVLSFQFLRRFDIFFLHLELYEGERERKKWAEFQSLPLEGLRVKIPANCKVDRIKTRMTRNPYSVKPWERAGWGSCAVKTFRTLTMEITVEYNISKTVAGSERNMRKIL